MTQDEISDAIRVMHEKAKILTRCGVPSVERRATEIMAMSYCLVWAELPFESLDLLVEWEIPERFSAASSDQRS